MLSLLKAAQNRSTVRCIQRVLFRATLRNLVIYFILLVVFCVEVLPYYCARFGWKSINCSSQSDCTRILIVADPHLLGLNNEVIGWTTPITIWDSDRFLYKTYSHAFQFAKPDVVLFVGDMFEEGSGATDAEFNIYVKRMYDIFGHERNAVPHIWVPGDYDIGGEDGDSVTLHRMNRFTQSFHQPDITSIKNIKFYRINRITSTIPQFSYQNDFYTRENISVVVSHMPLLTLVDAFVDKVLDKIQPHVIFRGHYHRAVIISTQMHFRKEYEEKRLYPQDTVLVHDLEMGGLDVHEIGTPTCSYRLGFHNIGYGFAVIEDETIRYTVLWSPSRLVQIYFYCQALVLGLFLLVFRWCYVLHKNGNIKKHGSRFCQKLRSIAID